MPSVQPSLPNYQEDGLWYCGARRRNNIPCANRIPDQGYRCRYHGGNAPQVRNAKARERLETAAMRLVPNLVTGEPIDPIARLIELAREADAFRAGVVQLVNKLNNRIRYQDDKGAEQLRAEIVVYERALDRAARLYLDLCKLNLDERLMRIREREALAMLAALDAGLGDAGLTDEQQQAVKGATARHLRAVS